jgi:hypothetical protein
MWCTEVLIIESHPGILLADFQPLSDKETHRIHFSTCFIRIYPLIPTFKHPNDPQYNNCLTGQETLTRMLCVIYVYQLTIADEFRIIKLHKPRCNKQSAATGAFLVSC